MSDLGEALALVRARTRIFPNELMDAAVEDMAAVCRALGDKAQHLEMYVGPMLRCKECGSVLPLPDSTAVIFARNHAHGADL